jgi:hypothetical protein
MACCACGSELGAYTRFVAFNGRPFYLCSHCHTMVTKPWYDACRERDVRILELEGKTVNLATGHPVSCACTACAGVGRKG